jgi:hypothetical protein
LFSSEENSYQNLWLDILSESTLEINITVGFVTWAKTSFDPEKTTDYY